MKTVTVTCIRVPDMDVQPLPRFCIEQAARNPAIPRRFVDIRLDELRLVRNRIVRVEIFAVYQAIGGTGQNFLRGYAARFMAWVEHAIAPKVTRAGHRCERAITRQQFNFQKNIASVEVHHSPHALSGSYAGMN